MTYTIKNIDDNNICITFTFPAAEYDKSVCDYVEKHNEEFQVPGVRKGKMNRAMAEKCRGHEAVVRPVIKELMSNAYVKAANEYPEEIYYTPILRVEQEGPGLDLVCTARVQVSPAIKLGDYHRIALSLDDVEKAEENSLAAPVDSRADTRRYLLQSLWIEQLSKISTGEIPDTMAAERANQMLSAFDQQLANNGMELDQYYKECQTTEEELFQDFAEQAKKQLHTRLSLYELAKAENLLATESEYEAELTRLSEMSLMPVERLRELFVKREGAKVRKDIAIAKAADFVGKLIDEMYPAENK